MKLHKIISAIILILAFSLLFVMKDFGPAIRLLYASIGLIGFIKLAALFFEGKKFESKLGLLCYLFLWPGVSSDGFRDRVTEIDPKTGERFLEYWLSFLFGFIILGLCLYFGKGKNLYLNYLSLFSIMMIIHLGLINVIGDVLKLLGFKPNLMFDRPYLASSLRDFWSLRWNMAFVEMNKIFFVNTLKGKINHSVLLFFIFLISGVLHEIGISYSAGFGFGFPLFYFLIQGIGFSVEKRIKLGRVGTLAIILLPVPLLFSPEFLGLYFGMLYDFLFRSLSHLSVNDWISKGLLIGGLLQACVLFASFQVPEKLNWKEDLNKLSAFNKKVFWTYGGYILCIIIFISAVSIFLSFQESIEVGSKIWLIFIALFWGARLFIDFFYHSHEDWPEGPEFVIGHICLTTLFSTLVLIYVVLLYLLSI